MSEDNIVLTESANNKYNLSYVHTRLDHTGNLSQNIDTKFWCLFSQVVYIDSCSCIHQVIQVFSQLLIVYIASCMRLHICLLID